MTVFLAADAAPSFVAAHRALAMPALVAAALALASAASPAPLNAQDPDSVRAAADTSLLAPADTFSMGVPGMDVLGGALWPDTVFPPQARIHLGHIAEGFSDTPFGMGLLKTAMLEGEIAAAWVRVAGVDTLNLGRMQRAMNNVLHAIDPVEVPVGAGMGYGFRRAAEAVGTHAELAIASASDSIAPALAFHGPFMTRAAQAARARADDAVALALQVQAAEDVDSALRLVDRLAETVRTMMYGEDEDRDGRIGQTEAEVGLAQAAYHLSLVYRVNGAEMPTIRPDEFIDSLGLDTLGRQPDSIRFRRRRGF